VAEATVYGSPSGDFVIGRCADVGGAQFLELFFACDGLATRLFATGEKTAPLLTAAGLE